VLLLDGTWQPLADICHAGSAWANGDLTSQRLGRLMLWVMPLALGAIFLLLFVSANPVIEEWFTAFDFRRQAAHISLPRVGFWLLALSLVWPFVFMRAKSKLSEHAEAEVRAFAATAADMAPMPAARPPGLLFSEGAILRALILFNVLFAVQTVLDLTYLWGGVTLPHGMTYATYAHRGAYPLIVTTLLAAGFVLMTMRPGSEMERSPLFRPLVFLFVGQNVLLVISSILRLDLYAAGGRRPGADHRAHRTRPLQFMADPDESRRGCARTLCLLLHQLSGANRRLQRHAQPGHEGVGN
jgi:hypothetical protein